MAQNAVLTAVNSRLGQKIGMIVLAVLALLVLSALFLGDGEATCTRANAAECGYDDYR